MPDQTCSCQNALEQLAGASSSALSHERILTTLQMCICARYGIDEHEDLSFEHLAIMSIKAHEPASRDLSPEVLAKRIRQYDCHQTTLIAKMKTLFTIYVEGILGVSTNDDDLAQTKTLDAYADLLYEALSKKEGERDADA